jgi:hypothetical protein
MTQHDALQLVASLPPDVVESLEYDLERYRRFTGLYCDNIEHEEMRLADQATFPHLIKFSTDGVPELSNERGAEFMAAVSKHPLAWCRAVIETEYIDADGVPSPW